jgi:hypothetical protein
MHMQVMRPRAVEVKPEGGFSLQVRELPELKIRHRRGRSMKYRPAWDDRFHLEGAM